MGSYAQLFQRFDSALASSDSLVNESIGSLCLCAIQFL